MMNVERETTQDLIELSETLLNDVERIRYDWHTRLPQIKALLIEVENELYRRGK